MVLGKQWHAWKKPTIDFSSHVIQFEHEGCWLLIHGEPDLSKVKLLKATKMLKLECKFLYLCYLVNVDPVMDSQASGSSTTPALSLSSKIKVEFIDVFKTKLPTRLPPCKNVEHHIELVPGANPVI